LAGCSVREVSEWARHNSVAFTSPRYGGLFEDGSNGVECGLSVDRDRDGPDRSWSERRRSYSVGYSPTASA
jgi:hypothetical protein